MFDLIEKLRAKPEKVKKRIAFLVSLSVASFIFVVWLTVIYPDFKNRQNQAEKVSKLTPSPISTFSASVSEGLSGIGEEFSKLKAAISSFSISPAYYKSSTTVTSSTTSPLIMTTSTTTE